MIAIIIVIKRNIVGIIWHWILGIPATTKELNANNIRWHNNWHNDDLKEDERTTGVCLFKIKITKIKIFAIMQKEDVERIIIPAYSLSWMSIIILLMHLVWNWFDIVSVGHFWHFTLPLRYLTWSFGQGTQSQQQGFCELKVLLVYPGGHSDEQTECTSLSVDKTWLSI